MGHGVSRVSSPWDTRLVYWVRVVAEGAPIQGAPEEPREWHAPRPVFSCLYILQTPSR